MRRLLLWREFVYFFGRYKVIIVAATEKVIQIQPYHSPQYIGLGGANFETTEHFSLANHVTSLFERPEIFEYEDVYHDICVSFAMIMCCILPRWPALNTTPFIMRFIRAHRSNVRLIPAFGLVLGLFAFSRYDYPMDNRYGSSLLAQSQDRVAVRMERALNVLVLFIG
ncbi:transmembrane protein [Rhizoctonia solani]|uniref:Transmembrane protein n=1 Tax=Rhizoctonia solani TaxID=456999 RepID=A0A8H8SZI2_9AGAM|nr:uncharacterized protein RhiXN_08660 [Rhizoctonia solani]QRW23624.1 transmembrane protein [Rhizoctonia solani]